MKKIFISTLALIIFFKVTPAFSECIGLDCPPDHGGPITQLQYKWEEFKQEDIWKPDNDKYWMNKFRGYKKYPIKFYNDADLYANSGVNNTRTVNVHDYKPFTPVSARKGQVMYDSTTYTITYNRGSGERYCVDRNATFFLRGNTVQLTPDMPLKPIGEVYMNNEYFMLLRVPNTSYVITMDDHGNIVPEFGQVDSRGFYLVGRDIIQIRPEGTIIKSYSDSKETYTRPRFNFSVTFGGVENKEIAFVIKDGSGEVQTRLVPMYKKMVTINGVKFQIIYVNSNYIEYQIVY